MTGSMYAAIAGLKTHMQNLNVIGNNIANVNTYGYKASRAVFKTSLYTTLSGGSNGTVTAGGTNPSQIGYGSNVFSVDVDMSTGNYAVTGISTDMMLNGNGFFLVGGKDIALNFDGSSDDINRLSSLTLTRVGDFEFRADGYLGKNDGNVVYGFLCTGYVTADMLQENLVDEDGNITPNPNFRRELVGMDVGDPIFSDQLVPIRYPRVEDAYYAATGERLDPNADYNDPNSNSPFQTDGKTLKAGVSKGLAIAYPTTYTYQMIDDPNNAGTQIQGVLCIDANGVTQYQPENNIPTGWTRVEGHLHDAGADDINDISDLEMGTFNGISVDPNTGIITANSDDTGEVVVIGCIAIGRVSNPNGVTNLGDNYYKAGDGSGKLTIGISGGNAANMGISQVNKSLQLTDEDITALTAFSTDTKIISNGLEMSKTDLAQEIANMILTQRGYQANTRIVTVTDSMLEELVNMKR